MEGLEAALETSYGVPIDYWIELNMPDFPSLVERSGCGSSPLRDQRRRDRVQHPAGLARIDGATALAYLARGTPTATTHAPGARCSSSRRSQSRISLLDEEFDLEALLALLTTLRTNAPLTDLPTLLQVVGAAADASVSATVLAPPRFSLYTGIEAGTDGARSRSRTWPRCGLCPVADGELIVAYWRAPQLKQTASTARIVVPHVAQSAPGPPRTGRSTPPRRMDQPVHRAVGRTGGESDRRGRIGTMTSPPTASASMPTFEARR